MNYKRLFNCIVLFFCSFFVQAEIVNWFTPEFNWSATNGVTFSFDTNLSYDETLVDVSGKLDMKEFQAFLGFQVQPSIFDVTTYAVYAPTFFKRFNFGAKTIAHLQCFSESYLEADFLYGLYLSYATEWRFKVAVEALKMLKASRIFSIADDVSWLKSDSYGMGIYFYFRPIKPLLLSAEFTSYSLYKYNLFLCPEYRAGIEYKFSDFFNIGLTGCARFIDQFTLSSRFDGMDARCYIRLEF